jgi:primosomal protein N''
MTSPTIEIDLAKILERIEQNLTDFRKELADFRKEMNQRLTNLEIGQARLEERLTGEMKALDERLTGQIKALDERLTGQIKALDERLTGEIKTVNAKLDGLGKRLDTQEFINRSVMVGLVLAIAAGVVKLFFPDFPGNP